VPAFCGASHALVAASVSDGAGGETAPPAVAAVLSSSNPFVAAGTNDLASLWRQQRGMQSSEQTERGHQQQQQQQQQRQQEQEAPGREESRSLSPFQRLLLVRALREDALCPAFASYTSGQLGPDFDPTSAALGGQRDGLSAALADSSPTTPLVLVLAPGADPLAALLRAADAAGRAPGRGLHLVSLGQGQGPVAEGLVHLAMKAGDWVCLQVRVPLSHVIRCCAFTTVPFAILWFRKGHRFMGIRFCCSTGPVR
jgi:hypothetical protein